MDTASTVFIYSATLWCSEVAVSCGGMMRKRLLSNQYLKWFGCEFEGSGVDGFSLFYEPSSVGNSNDDLMIDAQGNVWHGDMDGVLKISCWAPCIK